MAGEFYLPPEQRIFGQQSLASQERDALADITREREAVWQKLGRYATGAGLGGLYVILEALSRPFHAVSGLAYGLVRQINYYKNLVAGNYGVIEKYYKDVTIIPLLEAIQGGLSGLSYSLLPFTDEKYNHVLFGDVMDELGIPRGEYLFTMPVVGEVHTRDLFGGLLNFVLDPLMWMGLPKPLPGATAKFANKALENARFIEETLSSVAKGGLKPENAAKLIANRLNFIYEDAPRTWLEAAKAGQFEGLTFHIPWVGKKEIGKYLLPASLRRQALYIYAGSIDFLRNNRIVRKLLGPQDKALRDAERLRIGETASMVKQLEELNTTLNGFAKKLEELVQKGEIGHREATEAFWEIVARMTSPSFDETRKLVSPVIEVGTQGQRQLGFALQELEQAIAQQQLTIATKTLGKIARQTDDPTLKAVGNVLQKHESVLSEYLIAGGFSKEELSEWRKLVDKRKKLLAKEAKAAGVGGLLRKPEELIEVETQLVEFATKAITRLTSREPFYASVIEEFARLGPDFVLDKDTLRKSFKRISTDEFIRLYDDKLAEANDIAREILNEGNSKRIKELQAPFKYHLSFVKKVREALVRAKEEKLAQTIDLLTPPERLLSLAQQYGVKVPDGFVRNWYAIKALNTKGLRLDAAWTAKVRDFMADKLREFRQGHDILSAYKIHPHISPTQDIVEAAQKQAYLRDASQQTESILQQMIAEKPPEEIVRQIRDKGSALRKALRQVSEEVFNYLHYEQAIGQELAKLIQPRDIQQMTAYAMTKYPHYGQAMSKEVADHIRGVIQSTADLHGYTIKYASGLQQLIGEGKTLPSFYFTVFEKGAVGDMAKLPYVAPYIKEIDKPVIVPVVHPAEFYVKFWQELKRRIDHFANDPAEMLRAVLTYPKFIEDLKTALDALGQHGSIAPQLAKALTGHLDRMTEVFQSLYETVVKDVLAKYTSEETIRVLEKNFDALLNTAKGVFLDKDLLKAHVDEAIEFYVGYMQDFFEQFMRVFQITLDSNGLLRISPKLANLELDKVMASLADELSSLPESEVYLQAMHEYLLKSKELANQAEKARFSGAADKVQKIVNEWEDILQETLSELSKLIRKQFNDVFNYAGGDATEFYMRTTKLKPVFDFFFRTKPPSMILDDMQSLPKLREMFTKLASILEGTLSPADAHRELLVGLAALREGYPLQGAFKNLYEKLSNDALQFSQFFETQMQQEVNKLVNLVAQNKRLREELQDVFGIARPIEAPTIREIEEKFQEVRAPEYMDDAVEVEKAVDDAIDAEETGRAVKKPGIGFHPARPKPDNVILDEMRAFARNLSLGLLGKDIVIGKEGIRFADLANIRTFQGYMNALTKWLQRVKPKEIFGITDTSLSYSSGKVVIKALQELFEPVESVYVELTQALSDFAQQTFQSDIMRKIFTQSFEQASREVQAVQEFLFHEKVLSKLENLHKRFLEETHQRLIKQNMMLAYSVYNKQPVTIRPFPYFKSVYSEQLESFRSLAQTEFRKSWQETRSALQAFVETIPKNLDIAPLQKPIQQVESIIGKMERLSSHLEEGNLPALLDESLGLLPVEQRLTVTYATLSKWKQEVLDAVNKQAELIDTIAKQGKTDEFFRASSRLKQILLDAGSRYAETVDRVLQTFNQEILAAKNAAQSLSNMYFRVDMLASQLKNAPKDLGLVRYKNWLTWARDTAANNLSDIRWKWLAPSDFTRKHWAFGRLKDLGEFKRVYVFVEDAEFLNHLDEFQQIFEDKFWIQDKTEVVFVLPPQVGWKASQQNVFSFDKLENWIRAGTTEEGKARRLIVQWSDERRKILQPKYFEKIKDKKSLTAKQQEEIWQEVEKESGLTSHKVARAFVYNVSQELKKGESAALFIRNPAGEFTWRIGRNYQSASEPFTKLFLDLVPPEARRNIAILQRAFRESKGIFTSFSHNIPEIYEEKILEWARKKWGITLERPDLHNPKFLEDPSAIEIKLSDLLHSDPEKINQVIEDIAQKLRDRGVELSHDNIENLRQILSTPAWLDIESAEKAMQISKQDLYFDKIYSHVSKRLETEYLEWAKREEEAVEELLQLLAAEVGKQETAKVSYKRFSALLRDFAEVHLGQHKSLIRDTFQNNAIELWKSFKKQNPDEFMAKMRVVFGHGFSFQDLRNFIARRIGEEIKEVNSLNSVLSSHESKVKHLVAEFQRANKEYTEAFNEIDRVLNQAKQDKNVADTLQKSLFTVDIGRVADVAEKYKKGLPNNITALGFAAQKIEKSLASFFENSILPTKSKVNNWLKQLGITFSGDGLGKTSLWHSIDPMYMPKGYMEWQNDLINTARKLQEDAIEMEKLQKSFDAINSKIEKLQQEAQLGKTENIGIINKLELEKKVLRQALFNHTSEFWQTFSKFRKHVIDLPDQLSHWAIVTMEDKSLPMLSRFAAQKFLAEKKIQNIKFRFMSLHTPEALLAQKLESLLTLMHFQSIKRGSSVQTSRGLHLRLVDDVSLGSEKALSYTAKKLRDIHESFMKATGAIWSDNIALKDPTALSLTLSGPWVNVFYRKVANTWAQNLFFEAMQLASLGEFEKLRNLLKSYPEIDAIIQAWLVQQAKLTHYMKFVEKAGLNPLEAIQAFLQMSPAKWVESPEFTKAALAVPGIAKQYEKMLANIAASADDTFLDHLLGIGSQGREISLEHKDALNIFKEFVEYQKSKGVVAAEKAFEKINEDIAQDTLSEMIKNRAKAARADFPEVQPSDVVPAKIAEEETAKPVAETEEIKPTETEARVEPQEIKPVAETKVQKAFKVPLTKEEAKSTVNQKVAPSILDDAEALRIVSEAIENFVGDPDLRAILLGRLRFLDEPLNQARFPDLLGVWEKLGKEIRSLIQKGKLPVEMQSAWHTLGENIIEQLQKAKIAVVTRGLLLAESTKEIIDKLKDVYKTASIKLREAYFLSLPLNDQISLVKRLKQLQSTKSLTQEDKWMVSALSRTFERLNVGSESSLRQFVKKVSKIAEPYQMPDGEFLPHKYFSAKMDKYFAQKNIHLELSAADIEQGLRNSVAFDWERFTKVPKGGGAVEPLFEEIRKERQRNLVKHLFDNGTAGIPPLRIIFEQYGKLSEKQLQYIMSFDKFKKFLQKLAEGKIKDYPKLKPYMQAIRDYNKAKPGVLPANLRKMAEELLKEIEKPLTVGEFTKALKTYSDAIDEAISSARPFFELEDENVWREVIQERQYLPEIAKIFEKYNITSEEAKDLLLYSSATFHHLMNQARYLFQMHNIRLSELTDIYGYAPIMLHPNFKIWLQKQGKFPTLLDDSNKVLTLPDIFKHAQKRPQEWRGMTLPQLVEFIKKENIFGWNEFTKSSYYKIGVEPLILDPSYLAAKYIMKGARVATGRDFLKRVMIMYGVPQISAERSTWGPFNHLGRIFVQVPKDFRPWKRAFKELAEEGYWDTYFQELYETIINSMGTERGKFLAKQFSQLQQFVDANGKVQWRIYLFKKLNPNVEITEALQKEILAGKFDNALADLVMVPEHVWEFINSVYYIYDRPLWSMLQFLEGYNRWWKNMILFPFPSFAFRNFLDDSFKILVAGKSFKDLKATWKYSAEYVDIQLALLKQLREKNMNLLREWFGDKAEQIFKNLGALPDPQQEMWLHRWWNSKIEARAIKGEEYLKTPEGQKALLELKEARRHGLFDNTFLAMETINNEVRMIEELGPQIWSLEEYKIKGVGPFKVVVNPKTAERRYAFVWPDWSDAPIIRQGRHINSLREEAMRYGLYRAMRDKGFEVTEAVDQAYKIFYDYSPKSVLERQVKTFIPFWMFMKNNYAFWISQIIENPWFFAVLGKISVATGEPMLPPALLEGFPVLVWKNDKGETYLYGSGLSFEELNNFVLKPGDNPFQVAVASAIASIQQVVLSNLQPLIKMTGELTTNRSFFFDTRITEFDRAYPIARMLFGYKGIADIVGYKEKVLKDGTVLYRMDPYFLNMLSNSPFARFYITAGKFSEDRSFIGKVVDFVSGMRTYEVDDERKNKLYKRAMIQVAEDLQRMGYPVRLYKILSTRNVDDLPPDYREALRLLSKKGFEMLRRERQQQEIMEAMAKQGGKQ